MTSLFHQITLLPYLPCFPELILFFFLGFSIVVLSSSRPSSGSSLPTSLAMMTLGSKESKLFVSGKKFSEVSGQRFYHDQMGKNPANFRAKGHPSFQRNYCAQEDCETKECGQPCSPATRGKVFFHITHSRPDLSEEEESIISFVRLQSRVKKERGIAVIYRDPLDLSSKDAAQMRGSRDLTKVMKNDIENLDEILPSQD